MTHLKLIQGNRRELEFQFLTTLFTPGGNAAADALKKQLTRPAKGRMRAMSVTSSSPLSKPPSSS
jgi:hypothetical protein